MTDPANPDPWAFLRRYTSARIGLGRAGAGLPTSAWLDFKTAHAAARAAVWAAFKPDTLAAKLQHTGLDVVTVASQAADRPTYLQRPDLGRCLHAHSRALLQQHHSSYDLVIVISDGLSALAVHHCPPVVSLLLSALGSKQWKLAPLVIVPFGRVALEDEIGVLLGARVALMLLGERPGLGSPDSLGAYMVHGPRPGRTDAERNCVSNIRPDGLCYEAAVETLCYLLQRALTEQLSGVKLKDERPKGSTIAQQRQPPGLAG